MTAVFGQPYVQMRGGQWERAGVAADELSSIVLAAGVDVPEHGVGREIARVSVQSGHAVALTLAQLRATEWEAAPYRVWVVENPSILAMAVHRFRTAQCAFVVGGCRYVRIEDLGECP